LLPLIKASGDETANASLLGRVSLRNAMLIAGASFAMVLPLNTTVFSQAKNANGEVLDNRLSKKDEKKNNEDNNNAQTQNPLLPVPNTGTANASQNQSCTIVVTQPGTLGSGIENLQLSSKIFNGRPGIASVTTTNGSYRLTLDRPLGFTGSPAGGNSNITMTASFLGRGVTNFSEQPGNVGIRLKNGLTIVETHLTAGRNDGVPFQAGHYSAQLTLRCE